MTALTESFEAFHSENPHVYDALVALALDMRRRGMKRVSVDFVYQVARWEVIKSTGDIEYKLNDHHRAFYARLIMVNEPELVDIFELRSSEADEWIVNILLQRQQGGNGA